MKNVTLFACFHFQFRTYKTYELQRYYEKWNSPSVCLEIGQNHWQCAQIIKYSGRRVFWQTRCWIVFDIRVLFVIVTASWMPGVIVYLPESCHIAKEKIYFLDSWMRNIIVFLWITRSFLFDNIQWILFTLNKFQIEPRIKRVAIKFYAVIDSNNYFNLMASDYRFVLNFISTF